MTHKALLTTAVTICTIAAALIFAEPLQAGTCSPVQAKGKAKDMATATTSAQMDLKQKAKSMSGKVTQTSTDCVPDPKGYVYKINAVVCPK